MCRFLARRVVGAKGAKGEIGLVSLTVGIPVHAFSLFTTTEVVGALVDS